MSLLNFNTATLNRQYSYSNYYCGNNSGFGLFDFSSSKKSSKSTKNENFRPYDYTKYGVNGDKISKLNPKMQEKVMQLLDYAKSQGMTVTIKSGYRTQAEQSYLLKTNRFAAKKSQHCLGKAVDLNIASGKDSDYKKLGDYAKSIGMRWGGDFKNPAKERWHFDLGLA